MKVDHHDETDLLETLARRNAVLQGINRIFHEALGVTSEADLGRVCLAVVEEVTGAAFGFMGELNLAGGRLHDLALSDRALAHFTRDDPLFPAQVPAGGFPLRGLFGAVLLNDRSVIANDPPRHPAWVGQPAGHPPVTAFMGVPLRQNGRLIGMIGLGNRPGGFRDADRRAAEEMAPAIVQALFRRRAEIALRESEEIRRVSMELVPAMLWRADATGQNIVSNGQWRTLTGQQDAEALGSGWIAALHPDDAAAGAAAFRATFVTGEPLDLQIRIRRHDGEYRWFLMRQVPMRDADGTVTHWFGAAIDIHDMRLLEERQRMLVAELQHRVGNILTAVRSVFTRTLDGGGTLEDIANHFSGRLEALARTQAVVTRTAARDVDLEDLLREELLAVGVGDGLGVTIGGPDVRLPARVAEALGLAAHELAINSVKYGALKVARASLDIHWSVAPGDARERRLHLVWHERGVPVVPVSPDHHGFGRDLIEEALPQRLGADTTIEFLAGGVRCTIVVPLGPAPE